MLGIKKRLLEAIFFLENMPVSIEELVKYLKLNKNECLLLVEQLIEEYSNKKSGIEIKQVAGGYQMHPADDLKEHLVEIYADRKKSRLSRAMLETLAIIAWKQPITRPEIESVRGVDCTSAIKILIEKELIEEKGRKEVIGRPILYGTTNDFLRYFGLKNLDELPKLEEIKNAMFRPIKKGEIENEEIVEQSEIDFKNKEND